MNLSSAPSREQIQDFLEWAEEVYQAILMKPVYNHANGTFGYKKFPRDDLVIIIEDYHKNKEE